MRIWDVPPEKLCRNHLLGEYRELHAIWSILIYQKKGYAHHPETLRWKGKQKALYLRHEQLVKVMLQRGYHHLSPLEVRYATGESTQDTFLDSYDEQARLLRQKKCRCNI
ncbi:MAG TPA: pyrimidine dimer DNA glycosylase/endonuclease V [Candidatus Thermoplasmatota archaeon]|nr:pyrimidine dimer DNA glycosylase/endonuclease V [Candidatus Thermoplasmatota archaeon]